MSQQTLDAHIATSPDMCSGQPHVAGHRITVRQIAVWHDRMGLSADEIATQHGLSVASVYAALAYYFDHRAEIDAFADQSESLIAELKLRHRSKLDQSQEQ